MTPIAWTLLSLSLLACKDKDAVASDSEAVDTDDGVQRDTEIGPIGETGETGDPWEGPRELALYPANIALHAGGVISYRAVGTDDDGNRYDEAPVWSVDDKKVATVDADGVLTAVGPGAAVITATAGDANDEATVEVRDDRVIKITVIDGDTGKPIPEARIVDDNEKVVTDAKGFGELHVLPDGAPVWVMAYASNDGTGRIPAVLIDVTARELVIPLRRQTEEDAAPVTINGDVDLSGCESSDWDELIVGIASATLQQSPLFFDAGDLLAEDRPIDFVVGEVDLPSNLYLESYAEDYSAKAFAGDFGVWTMAGPVEIAKAASGISDSTDALSLLEANLDHFSFDWSGGYSAEAGESASVNLAPSLGLDDTFTVDVPELTLGFQGDEEPLLLPVWDVGSEGYVVTGLGLGSGTIEVKRVDPAELGWKGEGKVVAYGEVGGVGTGGARVISMGDVVDGHATPPAWQDVPFMDTWDEDTYQYSFFVDEDAQVTRIYVRSGNDEEYDFYFPPMTAGEKLRTGRLPDLSDGPAMSWQNSFWHMTSVETFAGTYDSMMTDGGLDSDLLAEEAMSVAYVKQHFTAD